MTEAPLTDDDLRRLEHPEEFTEPDHDTPETPDTETETTETETTEEPEPAVAFHSGTTTPDSGAVQKALSAISFALDALENAAAAIRSHIDSDANKKASADKAGTTKPL